MGTPATAFSAVLHTVVAWFGVLWVSALITSRIYMFHDAYQNILQQLTNDGPLLEMCGDAQFVAMMRQHTDVCIKVQHNAEVNPWLKALDVALNTPTLCGDEACTDIAARLLARGGWTAVGCVLLLIVFSPNVLIPLLRRTQRYVTTDVSDLDRRDRIYVADHSRHCYSHQYPVLGGV